MFDCVMRNGRVSHSGQVPEALDRRSHEGKASEELEGLQIPTTYVSETLEASGDEGEHANSTYRGLITFGSIPADECAEESLVLQGTGRRKAVTWMDNIGVRISPSVYQALTKRAPPTRCPNKQQVTESTIARYEADARPMTDARDLNGPEACDENVVVVAHRPVEALSDLSGSRIEVGTPQLREAPGTPVKTESGLGHVHRKVGESVQDTSHRSVDHDDNGDESIYYDPQYIIDDYLYSIHARKEPSLGENIVLDNNAKVATCFEPEVNAWYEEVCCSEGSPERVNILPDWYQDQWSRSNHLSICRDIDEAIKRISDGVGSIRVNSLICKVDESYVYSDDENAEVVRNPGKRNRVRKYVGSPARSQSSGIGPYDLPRSPSVFVNDNDKDGIHTHIYISSDEQSDYRDKGKGKSVEKKKKKKRTRKSRPSLGIAIDEVQLKPDPDEPERRTSTAKLNSQGASEMPNGFQSGGYAQSRYGRSSERSISNQYEQPVRSLVRSARTLSHRYSMRSQSRSEVRQPNDDETGRSTTTRSYVSRGRVNSPEPSGSPSGSSESSESDSSEGSGDSDDSDSESGSTETAGNQTRREDRILKTIKKLQKENKRLKRKFKRQARAGYKAQPPKTYKGDEPDIEEYDQFLFDYDNWIIETGLSRDEAVRNVSRFLGGKAGRWYMAKIAPNLGKTRYKMKDVYKLMYQYCFPPDFKENLRKKYERLTQEDQSVQDFFADLELHRTRLNDITDLQHVRRAWDGTARYIQSKWIIRGIRPDHTTIDELRNIALDIESAYSIKRAEKLYDYEDSHAQSCSQSSDENEEESDSSSSDCRDNQNQDRSIIQSQRNNLTDAEKEQYRVEGRCWTCHRIGHISRYCRSNNLVRPTEEKALRSSDQEPQLEAKVRASSAFLKELDRLHRLRDEIEDRTVKLNVGCMRIFLPKSHNHTVLSQGYGKRNSIGVKDLESEAKISSEMMVNRVQSDQSGTAGSTKEKMWNNKESSLRSVELEGGRYPQNHFFESLVPKFTSKLQQSKNLAPHWPLEPSPGKQQAGRTGVGGPEGNNRARDKDRLYSPLNDPIFDKERFDALREIFWRCWLAATHEQELFMNLAGQIEGIHQWPTTEKYIVSDETDLEDSNELIAAFIDRLSPPRDDTDSYDHLALVDLKCCLVFVQGHMVAGCRERLPQCFGAIIERLWYIITSGREGLDPMSDVLGTVIGWYREMEELSERPTKTTAIFLAKLIHQMIETDFLSLVGRIVFALVPSMEQSRNSRNFANNARFLRGTEGLFESIAKIVPAKVLAKCFKEQGIEWWKVNDHIELLSLAMIPQDKPRSNGSLPSEIRFYDICSEVWKSVGNCIQHTVNSIEFVHRCTYRRCPDPITIEGAVHECSGCHRVQYCSARCQALDWMYDHGAKAHHGVCLGSK